MQRVRIQPRMIVKKSVAVFGILVIGCSNFFVPIVTAKTLYNGVGSQTQQENVFKPVTQQTKTTHAASSSDASPQNLGLADMGFSNTSAQQRLPVTVQKLEKQSYSADEEVTVKVSNPDKGQIKTEVVNDEGEELPVLIEQVDTANSSELHISTTNQFKPGKYTVVVTDASGRETKQDFTWGVLAFNTDKAVYAPNDNAFLSMAVLDEKGAMVCDADVELLIKNRTAQVEESLTTGNGKIIVNQECNSTEFTLKPDYEANYTPTTVGTYDVTLKAKTKNGEYMITDEFNVRENQDFVIKRTSATRLYPPIAYPMNIEVTANKDFTGVITETVPESFTIIPSEEYDSYDDMNTVYLQGTDPANALEKKVLGSSDSSLTMPFEGRYTVSQGFGHELTDNPLKQFYSHYGLAGHDGIDFALPMGTPVYAVDAGEIVIAGEGDYGITVILQHAWGKSYYGHLSRVTAVKGGQVEKGALIGYSGNTGESTGPHLHFGIKPINPDLNNGYSGKIDPMPLLPKEGQEAEINVESLVDKSGVLAASTSSQEQIASASPDISQAPLTQPEASKAATIEDPIPASTSAAFTVDEAQIEEEVKESENPVHDRIKLIHWNVSVKKGEKLTLSYMYKAPMVSPQFYTVGPLKFFQNGATEFVYDEGRKWQIAADAIGVGWYDYNWQYRKQITIQDAQVPATQTNFPVVINLSSDAALAANAQADADDILFTDSTGKTKLSHEIETYTSGTGALVAWVKVPTLNGSSNTDIYMYYGNPLSASQQSAANVWDSNFRNVYHMKGTSGSAVIPDSATATGGTENGAKKSGTSAGQPANVTTGKIGDAQDFNRATTDYIQITGFLGNPTNLTITGWFNLDTNSGFSSEFFSIGDYTQIKIDADPGGTPYIDASYYNGGSFSTNFNVQYEGTGWHYIAYIVNDTGNTQSLYVDNVLIASSVYTPSPAYTGLPSSNTQMGRHGYQFAEPRYFDGRMDEMRLSNSARSANWVATEYNNQNSPGTFYTLGGVETKAYAPAPNELMRHGKFFDSTQSEQPFVF